jgi:hypothetical protein
MRNVTLWFRCALVASWAFVVIGVLVDILFPSLIPPTISEEFASYTPPAFDAVPLVVLVIGMIILTLLTLVITIGLFRFKSWAPRLAVYLTIVTLVVYPFAGAIVESGWSAAALDLSTMLWGAVLAAAHLPPLAERFSSSGMTANISLQADRER